MVVAAPATATTAVFSLASPNGQTVHAGDQITVTVQATFDQIMADCEYQLSASGTPGATVTARSLATSLTYLSTIEADPFNVQLPYDLKAGAPMKDVLAGLLAAHHPGTPDDGVAAGTNVVLATYTIRVSGSGTLTLDLSLPNAAQTQTDPNSVLFDSVSVDPGAAAIAMTVVAVPPDFDEDGDVDGDDLDDFEACASGPGIPKAGDCDRADFDRDDDVDQGDFSTLQRCYGGPDNQVDPDCAGAQGGGDPSPPVADSSGTLQTWPAGLAAVDDDAGGTDPFSIAGCGGNEPASPGSSGCEDASAAVTDAASIRVSTPPGLRLTSAGPVGMPAPPFILTTFDTSVVSNATLADTILVLNFVAPDCPWCKRQIPVMDRLDAVYWQRGVRFINVIGRLHREYRDDEVQSILAGIGSRIAIARDPGGTVERAFAAMLPSGNLAYPTAFVLGPGGRIEAIAVGAGKEGIVQARLDALLAELPNKALGYVVPQETNGPTTPLGPSGFTPTTYDQQKAYVLPLTHIWRFPVMGALGRSDIGELPSWQYDLQNLQNSTYRGKYILGIVPNFAQAFGFALSDGPAYPTPIPAAGVWLIEYNAPSCFSTYRNPLTPEPPTYQEAKASADAYCQSLCGSGFEMTDFDMSQWKYACYGARVGTQYRSYQVSTWGGSECSKTLDNGLIQACNPLTGLVEVRTNLDRSPSFCLGCDLDGDGVISLKDLTISRNQAFGPRQQGLGQTFPIIYDAYRTIDQSLPLTQLVLPQNQEAVDYIEITHWDANTPVNCNDPNSHLSPLLMLTTSDQASTTLFGQALANGYCRRLGATYCATGALGYTIGHCRINKDGTHSIRVVAGYCMACL